MILMHVTFICLFLLTETQLWSKKDAGVMVDIRVQMKPKFDGGQTQKTTLWNQVAAQVTQATGHVTTGTQCDNKWKAIKRKYSEAKGNNTVSGMARMDCPFYAEMDEIYGDRACNQPEVIVDSLDDGSEVPAPPPAERPPKPPRQTAQQKMEELQEAVRARWAERDAKQERRQERREMREEEREAAKQARHEQRMAMSAAILAHLQKKN